MAIHGQYVDDTSATIVAKCIYVDNLFTIFRTLGEASSLFIKEVGVKAVLLGDGPIPPKLEDLDCPLDW